MKRGFRYIDAVDGTEASEWRARIRSNLAGIRLRQGRRTDAVAVCHRAISEAESVGELRALAHACYVLDWALVELGRSGEATHSGRALDIYGQLGDPEHESKVLNNLGMFAYFDGRWDDAIALYRRAGARSERAGRPADVAYTDCNVGEILADQGHLDDAERALERARRVWSGTGERQAVAFVNVLLGRLAVRRGDDQRGVSLLEAAMADLRRFGIDGYADFAQALIAEAEAFAGDAPRALALARRGLETGDRHRPLLQRVAGIALARLGRKDAAERALMSALDAARERQADYDIAAAIDVLDALGSAALELRRDRDQILGRLRIDRLPAPALP